MNPMQRVVAGSVDRGMPRSVVVESIWRVVFHITSNMGSAVHRDLLGRL